MPVRTDSSYACCGSVHSLACGCDRTRRVDAARSRVGVGRTFFMIPAFRLEKVMWRRDLSWMNLISIFLLSRPGLSSSSSSSSAADARGRLTPRGSAAPFSRSSCSSWTAVGSCATMSADMLGKLRGSVQVRCAVDLSLFGRPAMLFCERWGAVGLFGCGDGRRERNA